MAFNQPDGHVGEISEVVRVSDSLDSVQIVEKLRQVLLDRYQPLVLDVLFAKDVAELCAFCATAYRSRELLVLVERWIKIDEVDAFGIDATQNVKIVVAEDRPILPVYFLSDCPSSSLDDFRSVVIPLSAPSTSEACRSFRPRHFPSSRPYRLPACCDG